MLPAVNRGGRRGHRLLARRLGATGLALALSGCGGSGGGPLVLGLAVPLTDTDGQPDGYGELSQMGAQLALGEVNRERIDGRQLRLRIVNDKGDGSTAIAVADSLGQDEDVLAVIGHIYSGTTVAA